MTEPINYNSYPCLAGVVEAFFDGKDVALATAHCASSFEPATLHELICVSLIILMDHAKHQSRTDARCDERLQNVCFGCDISKCPRASKQCADSGSSLTELRSSSPKFQGTTALWTAKARGDSGSTPTFQRVPSQRPECSPHFDAQNLNIRRMVFADHPTIVTWCDVLEMSLMILDPKLWDPTWDIDKLSKDPIPWRVHFLLLAWPLAHLGRLNPCRGGSFQGDIKVKRYEQVINLNWIELDWIDSKQNYSIRKGSEKDSCLTPGRHSESACSRVARPPGPLLQQWLRWRPWLPPQKEHRRLDGIGPLVGCNSSDSGFW